MVRVIGIDFVRVVIGASRWGAQAWRCEPSGRGASTESLETRRGVGVGAVALGVITPVLSTLLVVVVIRPLVLCLSS